VGNHFVPQHYLRGFTDPSCPKALWQFDKKTLSWSEQPASIAKIAQQRSFYKEGATELLAVFKEHIQEEHPEYAEPEM